MMASCITKSPIPFVKVSCRLDVSSDGFSRTYQIESGRPAWFNTAMERNRIRLTDSGYAVDTTESDEAIIAGNGDAILFDSDNGLHVIEGEAFETMFSRI